jgi:HAE1 family hydrophobic/amphiphilic exporter-1
MNNKWLRAIAREFLSLPPCLTVFCAIICASLISMPAAAQDTTTPTSAPIQVENIVARPIPERTVGLEPGKVMNWTLKDAILAALEKNIDIELERETVRFTQYSLISAQGYYDPTTSSRILYNKSITPNVNRFTGSDDATLSNNSLIYNFGASKNFERWGSFLSANFNNSRQISNTANLGTLYSPGLQFNFTQPLFKNFEIDQARRNIKVAKKQLDLNDAQFRARVIGIILRVEQAYWDLSLAIRNEDVRRQSVKLAETFLDNNKRQVEVGTMAPIEVVSAATSLESRRQDVFAAMNSVGIAENALKNLTADGPNDPLWSSAIVPVDSFDSKQISPPLADAIKLAHENRPEIRQQDLTEEMNKIDIDFARNQAKPQIDFIASYSTNGSAGTPALQSVPANCDNPVPDPDDSSKMTCAGVGPRVLLGNTLVPSTIFTPFQPAFQRPSDINGTFVGGYGTALRNMFNNKYRTWSVGVQFNFPLRNRTAKAQLGTALETKRQIDLQTRQLMQNIEVDVRNAVQAVETAKMRIDASEAATRYARLQLEGEEKRFAAGLLAAYFVLDRQNQLSMAQISELQAKADYNKAVANLRSVMSTTLSDNSINVRQTDPVKIK